MVLLGDMGLVESRFGPFRESVSVGARLMHGLEIVLILIQDRCTVCVECTISLRNRFGRTR
jgi:hypothetical protein